MQERRYSSWMLERIAVGDTVRLRVGSTTIGRHSSSAIRIVDSTYVSRHHAVIEVSEDDKSVSITDMSSNGIYVNERQCLKITMKLNDNDLIGIGVTSQVYDNNIDVLNLPLYQLKYAPIKPILLPNAKRSAPMVSNAAATTTPQTQSAPSTLTPGCNPIKTNNQDSEQDRENNSNQSNEKPGSSNAIKINKLPVSEEIFEISDDDDEVDVIKVPRKDDSNKSLLESISNDKQELSKNIEKKIEEIIIKDELIDDKDHINPSQKGQENNLVELNLKVDAEQPTPFNEIVISSLENSSNNNKDLSIETNAVAEEKTVKNNDQKKETLHVPIISDSKKEVLRSISATIENIFGDIENDTDLQRSLKEINPLVYKEFQDTKNLNSFESDDQIKVLNNGDYIVLTDDEDLALNENTKNFKEKELNSLTAPKSPNIFDNSLDKSKHDTDNEQINEINRENNNLSDSKPIDNIDLDEYTKYAPGSEDEDIEDLMFSQVIMNDMKSELPDVPDNQVNLPLPNLNNENPMSFNTNINDVFNIKQEPGSEGFSSVPKELENSCWIISDEDEDYDKELESKVNDWSNKIFSQSFNLLSQNMSQVYDLHEPETPDSNDDLDVGGEDDFLNFHEEDINDIADMYNNNEANALDAKPNTFSDNLNSNDNLKKAFSKEKKETISRIEDKKTEEFKIAVPKVITPKEMNHNRQSPVSEINNCSHLVESPLIRQRRLSKINPIIESPSSSENEFDIGIAIPNKEVNISKPDKAIVTVLPPSVIEAPCLPKHKGKHRGVSANFPKNSNTIDSKSSAIHKKIAAVKDKICNERFTKDLKRKWLEKPSVSKKRDIEHKKFIKDCRKDKLKKLAENKKSPVKGNIKRKHSAGDHEHKAKVVKVKVTTHNRGAFLLEPTSVQQNPKALDQTKQFKIPKNKTENNKKESPKRSMSIDSPETFSQQISKPDVLLLKRKISDAKKCDKPPPPRRHSTTQAVKSSATKRKDTLLIRPICKEAIAARANRTINKVTFASMEKNNEQSEENKRKLSALSSNKTTGSNTPLATSLNNNEAPANSNSLKSNLKSIFSTTSVNIKKKTVRFNDTPVIHYIERITGACKKINNKDVMPMTSYRDRRYFIRNAYPIFDHTNTVISKILCWSNEWLAKRSADAASAGDVIYPMPTHFNSFEHYKSIIFPLMKLEFVSTLEREYNATQKVKNFKVSLEYVTHNNDRIMITTKFFNHQNKELSDSSRYDLVLLEPDKRGGPQIFAYVAANRKGAGSFVTIVYEILGKNFTIEYFKAIKEFQVRPVMDKVRVHFGAFNSVYQLQSTPLFQKIINPLELLKCRPPRKKVEYCGFDKLNDKQTQVLLSTYVKIIDENTPNITLIQGPPGTGKSSVITNLVLQTLYGQEVRYLDKKILICAQSNAAVDVIAGKLYDISLRMRPEKRFRIIRYGILNKIQQNVLPIALQKVVEYDQLRKLQAKNKNVQIENKENLKNQILEFEAQIAEMSSRNVVGTVEADTLIEKKRQLQLMRNILNGSMRPEDERSLFSWYLSNANIVCATLSSCVNLMQYINFFDVCIIDEATQCTEPWTLLPLKFGINSLVLVGDTQQLPATVLSKKANELGLGTSMFTRIQQCLDNIPSSSAKGSKVATTTPNNIIFSLQTQYRMHPEICRWPNQYFYRNELINGKSILDFTKSPLIPFCILNLAYTQNNTCINGKITNDLEAEFVAKLLKALDGFIPNKYNSYGVITPYAHHCATLESSIRSLGLTNIMVNTIDSYQGLEKDVIVISNARTNGIGFLSNAQRLNVALTRAKKCLILCGNFKSLETVPAWRCLLQNARERKLYYEISTTCIADIQTNVIDKIKLKNQNH